MRSLIILILTIVSTVVSGQKVPLKKADFVKEQLNESWVIVKIEPGTSLRLDQDTKVKILHHAASSKKSILDGMCKVKLKQGQNPVDFCNELLRQENVIYAEPIIEDKPLYTPSDPNASNQSYLTKIKAYEAWDITRGDDDITIGIIDTGIALDHEDLAANLWINAADPIDGIDNDENGYIDDYYGFDFADNDNDPNADNSLHGSAVAGVASAVTDNGIGISGIGFNTKIAALKGFRSATNSSNGLFEALIYGVDNGMEILNLSWGSPRLPLQSEQDIINYAVIENNVVVIAAAGNDGNKEIPEAKFYPASYDNVLSVGATDINDNRWALSSYNHLIDLMAPGNFIYSTLSNNEYSTNFGTSFSAPMVAGAAALLKDKFPSLNARQIMERLRVSADDIYDVGNNATYDGKLGKGRLNVFRAVAENGLKSLRIEDIDLSTSLGKQFFFGDTIHINGTLINYLAKVNSPLLTTSSDTGLEFPTPSQSPGSMQTMQEKALSFQLNIPASTPPNSNMKVRIDMMDGSYHDFQFIEFTTAPDYADFGNENVSMTIAGNGNLGFTENSFNEGVGFQSEFGQLMKHAGFFIATSADSVSDNFIENYSSEVRSNDFTKNKNYKLSHHPGVDFYGYSEFLDTLHNVIIEQSSLAWENEDFLILRYRIINNSPDPLSNALVGMYTDWNLDDPTKNSSVFNADNQYIFTSNEANDQYTATQIIGTGAIHYSNLNIRSFNGNTAHVIDQFSDEIKYDFLTVNQIDSAGKLGAGNDVSSLIALSVEEIAPYSSQYVNVILAVNNSISGIESTLLSAREKLAAYEKNPLVLETFRICDLNQILIDPSSGIEFEFYEDPLGQNLIISGSTFQPEGVTSDTVFYARNMDSDYPTDFYQLRLQLFTDISDFEMSTDTLYLDNNTNIVSFADASLDAVSWSWNFGQGTIASIQHPSISFSDEGVYPISLTVTNAIGCEDTRVKNLVVATRPSAPSFDDFIICPNESITLADLTAEKLKVYSTNSSDDPFSGASVEVGPFLTDSIVYVSGIYDGFESAKTAVSVSVVDVAATIEIVQDTTNAAFRLLLNANVDNESTLEWFVDNVSFGDSSSILLDAEEGLFEVRLAVESIEGCLISRTKSLLINSSPTPIQNNVSKCDEQSIIIHPQNGTYFGFYSDASLTELIKKGTQLEVTDQEKIYIVGLDDGLPSQPIEVSISSIPFEVDINHSINLVASKNKVSLTASSANDILGYRWFVNSVFTEVISNPTLFLENDLYEIILQATSAEGCTSQDTITLDFREVALGTNDTQEFQIYPNPSNGIINIVSANMPESISIHDLSGQLLYKVEQPKKQLVVHFLAPGLYILTSTINGQTFEVPILLKK